MYGIGFAIWSSAMLLTGVVHGFEQLLAVRLLLGMGEAVAYPSYSRILSTNFRENQRGVANCLIDAGCKSGPALGILIGGSIMAAYGWRSFFLVIGALSLLWILPWSMWAPVSGRTAARVQGGPGIADILRKRAAWGTIAGLFCSNYAWYFMAFWVPVYFREERHFTESDLARIGQIPFWGIVAGTLIGGWLSDLLITQGWSTSTVRKSFASIGLCLSTVMVLAAQAPSFTVALFLLTASGFAFGLYSSNVWAITQTLAGPQAAGKWTGVQNFMGNFPGMFGLWFTGWLIQNSGGHYLPAFYVAAAFALAGVGAYVFLVGPVREIDWPNER